MLHSLNNSHLETIGRHVLLIVSMLVYLRVTRWDSDLGKYMTSCVYVLCCGLKVEALWWCHICANASISMLGYANARNNGRSYTCLVLYVNHVSKRGPGNKMVSIFGFLCACHIINDVTTCALCTVLCSEQPPTALAMMTFEIKFLCRRNFEHTNIICFGLDW